MEPSFPSLDLAMYPPESLILKEIFECNYDQSDMTSYYPHSGSNHHVPATNNVVVEKLNTYPQLQSVPHDASHTFGGIVPPKEADYANFFEEQPAMTTVFPPTTNLPDSHRRLPASTLPTPPQSPPSNESDLDNIIATFPEILEFPPTFLFHAVEDVLLDLETSPGGCYDSEFSLFAQPKNSADHKKSQPVIVEQIPKALKKDSMWGGGSPGLNRDDHKFKQRTVSESSEDNRCQSVYSDEECEHFPDTPYVSDEDVEHLDAKELSSNLNDIVGPCLTSGSAPTPCLAIRKTPNSTSVPTKPLSTTSPKHALSPPAYRTALGYANSVSIEHNYCEKEPTQSFSSQDVDTDEEVDVVTYEFPSKSSALSSHPRRFESSCDSAASSLATALPHSPSAQVKRQLQIAIQESLKNKQKRGRVGRPPKALKSVTAPSFPVDFANDISGALLKAQTQGKPASYTKRMREQHSEVLKTNKRRRATCKDPEEELEKRCNHNIMERNRRVNIKNLFDTLRQKVPDIQENERASKVLILTKSKEFIEQMEKCLLRIEYEEATEREKNQLLRKRLHSMQNLIH